MNIKQFQIEKALTELVSDYCKHPTKYMTENDIVIQAHKLIQKHVLNTKQKLSLHSELRPYIFEGDIGIHEMDWNPVDQINHASKCDLAIIDTSSIHWDKTMKKIVCLHSRKRRKKKLNYWRFLVYPVKAFKAAFEFKMRVRGNLSNIEEDILKLNLIRCKNSKCLTYMIILDKEASNKNMKTIRAFDREETMLITHEMCKKV